MIYFVDEDIQYSREFSVPLQMRGHQLSILPNADVAYDTLENADDIDLVIVDIMLATGDVQTSRFSSSDTDGFLETGLLLMRYLSDLRPEYFPRKFVVLTAAGAKLIQRVNSVCVDLDVPVLKKGDFRVPSTLANSIEGILTERGN
tara:strand:+ start:568 stop:1005 length:438 start_codon:yes stop_codon:yes gene_type:complete